MLLSVAFRKFKILRDTRISFCEEFCGFLFHFPYFFVTQAGDRQWAHEVIQTRDYETNKRAENVFSKKNNQVVQFFRRK